MRTGNSSTLSRASPTMFVPASKPPTKYSLSKTKAVTAVEALLPPLPSLQAKMAKFHIANMIIINLGTIQVEVPLVAEQVPA